MYQPNSSKSIISYAKKLVNRTLRESCKSEIISHGYSGKGNFGQILEKFYFGYEPNSNSEPDFKEAGLELKSSPLKLLKNGEFRSKERLVLNIINYLDVHSEEFENSSFWKKNSHLLLVFYLHEADKDLLDYLIKLVDEWRYPLEDLLIIKNDWQVISQKIKDGKAHELSEGDTMYLGACTKGSTAEKSYRNQPFSEEKAKQRAYSLKQGYINHIIANIANEGPIVYGKIIEEPKILEQTRTLEDIVISKFHPFYGNSSALIESKLGLKLNPKAKNYFSSLTNAILGIELGQKIEEFAKADIKVKTIRLKESNLPKENISFPAIDYLELVESNWEDSEFRSILESKFFFVFYQFEKDKLILRKVKFWNMPYADLNEVKNVWEQMAEKIKSGNIVKEITNNGVRKTYFPKKTENRVSHVRPHAKNSKDTYKLPVKDKLTGSKEYTKHCFWLNADYIRDEIFLK